MIEDEPEREGRQHDCTHLASHYENLSFYSERDGKALKGSQQRRDTIPHVLQRIRPTTQQERK